MPEHLKDRYQYYTKAEMDKFYKTGYTREIMSLQEAIRDYVVNYLLPGKYLGD
jgi:ADP-L-glycero-D-manno-heptose 6-epimerase